MKIGIFYFRRDLRIWDNTALNECIKNSDSIYPIFIFDPVQIKKTNLYFSNKCFSLMQIFIGQLVQYLGGKLLLLYGNPCNRLKSLVKHIKTQYPKSEISIYFNIDYTPYSIKRDSEIFDGLDNVFAFHDNLLTINSTISGKQDLIPDEKSKYYKKFTPFYENVDIKKIQEPTTSKIKNILELKLPNEYKLAPADHFSYSRRNALKQLSKKIDYAKNHDTPGDEDGTYRISHYLKFGVISIREAHHMLKNNKLVDRQLFWRDFYYIVQWHNPQMLRAQITNKSNSALNEKYNSIKWSYDKRIIESWKYGKTGFPIVDAGMRQLLQTGYMHNRVRLIVASFLTKICGVDWRFGEQWFAQNLIDYDPIVNNGNWLWVAGGGADSQPYFRVFNPWIQQYDHDRDCIYIKRWVPELKDIDVKIIHKWYRVEDYSDYIKPIIVYEVEKTNTYAKYVKLFD